MSNDVTVHAGALPVIEGAGDDSPASLVRFAIERGVDVAVLERLVALQERVAERDARTAFVEALTAFREECPPIIKTRENSQFRVTRGGVSRSAMYAPLEEIDRVARPVAAKHGLVWTWDTRVDGELMHLSCRLIHVLGHVEVTNVSMPYESKAGSSPQQKYGSTQSYGMRYSLIAALGLTTADEDTDGASAKKGAEVITDAQAADLSALMDEVQADRGKFFRWAGVSSVEALPTSKLAEAIRILEARRGA